MVRRRPYRYSCPDCKTMSWCVEMTALGGKVREPFMPRDGNGQPAVKVVEVLCWWCRNFHSPAEVEGCMALPEKRAANGSSTSSTSNALEKGLLEQYAELWEFLTATSYPDGRKRQTGRLTVSFDAGLLGLLLTDEETGQYAFLNGRNVTTLLEEAELRLSDGSLSWRVSRYNQRKRS